MSVVVRPAIAPADIEGCYAVRMTVFVEEQQVPLEEELDAYDAHAEHFVGVVDGRIVGTARLLDKGDGVCKIGRVAVLSGYRGQGIGRALMVGAMEAARGRFHTVALDAQVQVIPFYERLGFAAEGGVFMDAGIPHRRMTKVLGGVSSEGPGRPGDGAG